MKGELINLWNVDEKGGRVRNKTKQVIDYINSLEPMPYWDFEKVNKFEAIKSKALNQISAEKMLKVIGYRFNKIAGLYHGDSPPQKGQEHTPRKRF